MPLCSSPLRLKGFYEVVEESQKENVFQESRVPDGVPKMEDNCSEGEADRSFMRSETTTTPNAVPQRES